MNIPLAKNKVVLGLSGGVDSTTAALLLKEKGLEVTGLYFDVFEENKEGRERAETAAKQLGISFIYYNAHQEFEEIVTDNFCSEYLKGRTPNPCIICNPNIKFKVLLENANKIGAYYVATGHYAKTGFDQNLGWAIERTESQEKDQSYMLYRLSPDIISRLLLPLEGIESKEETRQKAREQNLFNAEAKDSQEICFIGNDENYVDYIRAKGYEIKKGDFVDKTGQMLGQHQGLTHYTIGQRKGLGITFGKPVFVIKMDPTTNRITLGDHNDLLTERIVSSDNFFPSSGDSNMPKHLENAHVYAKIRYAAKPAQAQIKTLSGGKIETVFNEKQRAATPGQSIVFYLENKVIGGGFIE